MDASREIRNFASIARLLWLARRRKICAWTCAFRAGAAHHALEELNYSGAITLAQYRLLDDWILQAGEFEKRKLGRAKNCGRAWYSPPKLKPLAKIVVKKQRQVKTETKRAWKFKRKVRRKTA